MFIEILDRLKGERGPLLPKKKPEKELQKIRDANFEKAKPALENPDEVRDMFSTGGGVQLQTPGVIKTKELYDLLAKAGLDLPPETRNASRIARVYGLERPKEVKVKYAGHAKPTVIKNPLQFYKKPTAAELKKIKEQFDINQLKKTSSGPGKEAFEQRKKRAIELLKTGNYTRDEVNNIILKEFPTQKSGMKTTIKNLAKNIKGVPLGTGESGKMVQKVIKDLKDLDKSKVKKMLAGGESSIPKLTKAVKEVIDVDDSLALRRVGQLIEEYAGRNRYLSESIKNDKIIKATGKLRAGLGEIGSSRLYGGIGGGLQRKAAEEAFAKEMNMKGATGKSAVAQTKRKITDLMPRGEGMPKYQTDMVKNIRSGYRFNSLPYSVFAQGLREDINQRKGVIPKGEAGISLDRQTSLYENRIQKAKTLEDKKKIASEYNKIAKDFAKDANKNLKKGQLPVRVLEFSFDSPNKTIKNKAAYEKYGDKFNEVYKKHGYSFKVPSDLKTLDQSLEFVKRPVGQAKIATAAEMGSPRVFSELIPGTSKAVEGTGKFLKSIPQDFTQGRKLRGVGKVLGVAALPLEAYFMKQMYDEGYTPGEILLSPLALDPVARAIRRRMRMSPVERQALTRQMIDSDESGLSSDFYTPYLEGSETVDPDAAMQKQIDREISDRKALAEERAEPVFDDSLVYNFKEGGPVDKGRRKFIKGMGILAALPFVGKYIKPATKAVETAAPAVAEGVKLGYDKFLMLVEKIKKLGTPNKRRTQNDLEEATVYRGQDGSEYELVEDLASGDVRVTRDKYGMKFGGDEAYDTIEDRSTFYLKKGQADETTKGKKPPDEYDEVQEVPSRDGTFDDVDDIKDDIVKEIEEEITGKKGFYKGGLTDTIAPERGPMYQGIAGAYQTL